ncbi:ABC transporter ATP-binding protein [Salinarimonas rosea]|uniref:ABC transporter ATP-binding protein n=1 Tax=Salinarimonas rosea TaxID=552063 RepID=UPI0003F5A5CD|nr:ABC transporter ATP-binding protein [Salinarimonas rosea]
MSAPHARASGAGRAAEAPEGAVVDRASGLGSHLGALGGLLSALRRSCGAKIWVALVFLVLGTLSEGASILLLLPILHLVESSRAQGGVYLSELAPDGIDLPAVAVGLEAMLAALVVLVALQVWFNRRKAAYFSDLLQAFSNGIRTDLFRAVAGARWDALSGMRRADVEYALTGEIERLNLSIFAVLGMLQSAIGLVVLVGLTFAISVPMTLFALAFGVLGFVALHPFRSASAQFGERLMRRRTDQFGIVTEFLHGLKTARSMNEEARHVALFEDNLARARDEARVYAWRQATGNGLFRVGLAVAGVAFAYVGLRVVALGIAELAVMLLVLMRIAPRFMALQAQSGEFLKNETAYRRLVGHVAVLGAAREIEAVPARPVRRPRHEILLDRVTYHHPAPGGDDDAPRAGLTDCTVRLRVGEITAVIGASGSGKSTLADIVTGLVRPREGAMRLDGEPLAPDQARAWRDHVAYLPQETFLSGGTVRDNLLVAAPDADDARLADVLAKAALPVDRLPQGLGTPVGERGGLLSGGERQRIALARALLRRPALLVLDEATSALDWESQARIADALVRLAGETTILTIAHRPSMVSFAHRVYALDGGRVVEDGETDALMHDPGSYLSQMLAHEIARREAPGHHRGPQVAAGRG